MTHLGIHREIAVGKCRIQAKKWDLRVRAEAASWGIQNKRVIGNAAYTGDEFLKGGLAGHVLGVRTDIAGCQAKVKVATIAAHVQAGEVEPELVAEVVLLDDAFALARSCNGSHRDNVSTKVIRSRLRGINGAGCRRFAFDESGHG